MNRDELQAECLREATRIHAGAVKLDGSLRNSRLQQAIDRYRAAGREDLVRQCEADRV